MPRKRDDTPSRRTRQLIILLLLTLFAANVYILNSKPAQWLPLIAGPDEEQIGKYVWRKSKDPALATTVVDEHPIRALMNDADHLFRTHEKNRSKTFKETVEKYRTQYGRHPPPRFDNWYKFARNHRVHNIDDFDQINSDLRPFWAVPRAEIRLYAAHASDIYPQLVATVSLRQGQVFQELWG
ncbi:hypothetical protein LTR49_024562 [Elasticomyces elasticus]|nr:hypothetical protein LTR49_024562 [Elasticomyces elasticus]